MCNETFSFTMVGYVCILLHLLSFAVVSPEVTLVVHVCSMHDARTSITSHWHVQALSF